jgi:VIT1/CCC1 family predicted Fe2+/Mn2+ transporter
VEEINRNMESDTEQTFRESVRRRMIIGVIMFAALPLLPIVTFLVQYSLPANATTILLIAFIVIGFLGALISLYYGMGSSMLFRGMDLLRKIAPQSHLLKTSWQS